MAPILIRNLGNYDYGLWEMFGAVLGYMGMLDLGLGPTVSRYAARHRGDGDNISQQHVFNSALVFMVVVGCLLALSFVIWAIYFPTTLAPEGQDAQRYTFLLLAFAVQVLIFFPGRVAESYLEGFQRYQIKNLIIIINSLVGATILYSYITPENGLVLLAVVNVVGGSVKYIIYLIFITRPNLVGVKYQLRDFSPSKLKELLVFGSKSLIQGVSTRIETATDSLVIGSFLGPAMVPFYSISANLVQYIRTFTQTITHVFMPVFSDMSARGESEGARSLYLSGSKYVVAIMVLLCVGVILVGESFVRIWIGPDFAEHARYLLPILVAFACIPYLNPFVSRYLTAIGKHGIFAKWSPVSAAINLCLSILFVNEFGMVGVAVASLIPVLLVVPIYFQAVSRELEISVLDYCLNVLVPVLAPVLASVVTFFLFDFAIDGYGDLLIASVSIGLVYLAVFFVAGLNKEERSFFYSKLLKSRT